MNAKELIGKMAIRTAPIDELRNQSGGGMGFMGFSNSYINVPNYYFCEHPIKIVNATDNHIVYEQELGDSATTHILSCKYCDDNWIDYEELVGSQCKQQEG